MEPCESMQAVNSFISGPQRSIRLLDWACEAWLRAAFGASAGAEASEPPPPKKPLNAWPMVDPMATPAAVVATWASIPEPAADATGLGAVAEGSAAVDVERLGAAAGAGLETDGRLPLPPPTDPRRGMTAVVR